MSRMGISPLLVKCKIATNVDLFYKLFVRIFRKSYTSSGRRKLKKNKKFVLEDELSETETTKATKKKRQRKVRVSCCLVVNKMNLIHCTTQVSLYILGAFVFVGPVRNTLFLIHLFIIICIISFSQKCLTDTN